MPVTLTDEQPDCSNCNATYARHNWKQTFRGACPITVWNPRGIPNSLYWPQAPDGGRAASWEPHPPLSPIEQLLVNNIETIREVLDDWLSFSTTNDYDQTQTPMLDADLEERAATLRREIAELTGELDS